MPRRAVFLIPWERLRPCGQSTRIGRGSSGPWPLVRANKSPLRQTSVWRCPEQATLETRRSQRFRLRFGRSWRFYETGAPAHGAGGGAFAQPISFSSSTKLDDNPLLRGRLAHGLGPGVRRAAPEIYTACIAEAARSIRDWIEMNLGSSKGTEAWTEIWDRAAQIDFAVSQCRTGQELVSK